MLIGFLIDYSNKQKSPLFELGKLDPQALTNLWFMNLTKDCIPDTVTLIKADFFSTNEEVAKVKELYEMYSKYTLASASQMLEQGEVATKELQEELLTLLCKYNGLVNSDKINSLREIAESL